MALPFARDVTFAALTEVASAVLNNLQDWLISLFTAWRVDTFQGAYAATGAGEWATSAAGFGTIWFTSTTAKALYKDLRGLRLGDAVTGVKIRAEQAGATSQIRARLVSVDDGAGGGDVVLADWVTSAAASGNVTLSLTVASPAALVTGRHVRLEIESTGAGTSSRQVKSVEYQLGSV